MARGGEIGELSTSRMAQSTGTKLSEQWNSSFGEKPRESAGIKYGDSVFKEKQETRNALLEITESTEVGYFVRNGSKIAK